MNRYNGAKAAPQSDYDAFPDYDNMSNDSESPGATFKKGMRVRHPIFGSGSVHQVEGSGDNTKVSIVFGDRTVKKFIARHANLTIL
jgi:DNA helicase-2/ATP-dependent DNA helicase PcrA